MISEVYLDNNATTLLLPEVQEAMCAAVRGGWGNPSSAHRSGEKTRKLIAAARKSVAELVNTPPESIVFGSGVTELNNSVISSRLNSSRYEHFVASAVEHPSVLNAMAFAESGGSSVTRIPVDESGIVDLAALCDALKRPTSLVSIQWVNSETGVIQPIREIAKICQLNNTLFHCDAAQAAGKLQIDLINDKIDFLTIAAHKMHGPSGIGALAVRNKNKLKPLFFGGSQEFGLRPGTENVIGIIGFGVAAEHRISILESAVCRMRSLRDSFEESVLSNVPDVIINGSTASRACNTTNLMFPHVDGAAIVALLDNFGIRCSQTSACRSNSPEPSHVLTAMGRSFDEAYSSVRFSFSQQNTPEDVAFAVTKLLSVLDSIRIVKCSPQQIKAPGVHYNEI